MVGLFSSAERHWVFFGYRDQDQDVKITSLNIKTGIKTLRNTILISRLFRNQPPLSRLGSVL